MSFLKVSVLISRIVKKCTDRKATRSIAPLLLTTSSLSLICAVSCGAEPHLWRIDNGAFSVNDIRSLSEYPNERAATKALSNLLYHKNPAARYFAAEALEAHISIDPNRLESIEAARGLIASLDDIRSVSFSPSGSPLSGCYRRCSVRARALLTLTNGFFDDKGLDKQAWYELLEERARVLDSSHLNRSATKPTNGHIDESPQAKKENIQSP